MGFFKERVVRPNQKVRVYLNWNKGYSVYSIADAKTGLVLAYSGSVTLANVEFKVSEAGQRRVREERCKNVHAWLVGEFVAKQARPDGLDRAIYYDPYQCDQFIVEGTNAAILGAERAHCSERRVWISAHDTQKANGQVSTDIFQMALF